MVRFGKHYKVNEGYVSCIEEGDYSCTIKSAVETQSKSGKPMVTMDLIIKNNGLIKYYLVDDRSDLEMAIISDMRITRFFDCFDIKRGVFNLSVWIGKTGWVHIKKGKPNEKGYAYPEVSRLYTVEEAKKMLAEHKQDNKMQDEYEDKYVEESYEDKYVEESYEDDEEVDEEALDDIF